MLHRPNKTRNTEDCYALKNLVKGEKQEKRPWAEKVQKIWGNERVDLLRKKKRVVFEKNQESEAKAARAEEINNFENMSLDNLQPEDGQIKSGEQKKRLS